ncbi:unnamed protein product [Rotaria sp. Silwood2]|nr:unnamed protein product [Rotaria sp. Silwood2]CAF4021677.1 unnamed protein product [Rotaria sp. Silwood2]
MLLVSYLLSSLVRIVFKFWHGDITGRQFLKLISTHAVSVGLGFTGGAITDFSATGCASLLDLALGPAEILVFLDTGVSGLICGDGINLLFRYLTEKFFSNGADEEINTQRKLYC